VCFRKPTAAEASSREAKFKNLYRYSLKKLIGLQQAHHNIIEEHIEIICIGCLG